MPPSGSYCDVEIPDTLKAPTLVCPDARDAVKLYVDGQYTGSRIMAPYRFPLPEGKHRLEIEVANTYANALEAYKAPAGLLKTPYITEG